MEQGYAVARWEVTDVWRWAVSSGTAAGPAELHAARESICCSHADGEGRQPREQRSCKIILPPQGPGACKEAHTRACAQLSSRTRNSPTLLAPRGGQQPRDSGHHSHHCSYGDFENLKQLVQIHLCFFITNGSWSDLPMLLYWGLWRPHHLGWNNAQAPSLCKELQILVWGCFFLRVFVRDKNMQTSCNFK